MLKKIHITMKEIVGAQSPERYLRSILTMLVLGFCLNTVGQTESTTATDTVQYFKGVVRDAKSKMPLPAVQVSALNFEAAATTDENGVFKIQVNRNTEVLFLKAFDYNPREVAVRGLDSLFIDMYPEEFTPIYTNKQGLNGQVKSSYDVSASTELDDFGQISRVSVDDLLQAEMGGNVRAISRSGLSGMGSNLFIRGLNSINLNAQPLIVVDGVIWNRSDEVTSLHDGFYYNVLDHIDINDIESVNVIKDGASIYGAKGSNGVLLIKTKRASDVVTNIEFNAVGGVTEQPASLPVMNGDNFRLYATDMLGTAGLTASQIDQLEYLQDDPNKPSYNTFHNNTNWDDEVYRLGTTQTYNVSVKGGDERALYAFSMGYYGDNSVIKTVDMQRLNTRFNADFLLGKIIDLGMNIGFSNVDRNLIDDGVNFSTSPSYLAMIKSQFLNPNKYTPTGTLTTDFEDSDVFGVGNPSAILANSINATRNYRLNIGLKPVVRVSDAFTLSTMFDYSFDKTKENFYRPIEGAADVTLPGYGVSENMARYQIFRMNNFFSDTKVHFKKQLNEVHRIDAQAGIRYIVNSFELDFEEGHNSGSDQKPNLSNELEFRSTDGFNNSIKSITNYVTANYSFDNRYFITGTVSMDGSSKFGSETQGVDLFGQSWGIFPSANAAWLISSENFMSGASFVDLLKLRAGYGLTGNDGYDPYAFSAYFVSNRYMNRANGLVIDNIGNEEIQWETTSKANIGIDAVLFNNRLTLSGDVYQSKTSDLLNLRELPEVAGPGYYYQNAGELSNMGFEVSANVRVLNLNYLKWELGASVGHYKNKIESLPNGEFTTSMYDAEILTREGYAAGVFYGYKTNGVMTGEDQAFDADLSIRDAYGDLHAFTAGDIEFVEVEEDGVIDENDKQIIGDPNPDYYGAFNSKFIIKNLSVDVAFSYSYGNDVYNYLRRSLESGDGFNNQSTAVLNRWYYEGQETNQPRAVYGDPMGNARFSDRWIEDGSFLRLKSLSVNYRIPINTGIINEINVWASANNLWTLTNYLGRDPEFSANPDVLSQGIDRGLIPLTKSYFLGVKFNL